MCVDRSMCSSLNLHLILNGHFVGSAAPFCPNPLSASPRTPDKQIVFIMCLLVSWMMTPKYGRNRISFANQSPLPTRFMMIYRK